MTRRPLILGSASLRRKAILRELGVIAEIHVPHITEVFYADDPRRTVSENARHKHDWCKQHFPNRHILTADTLVAFEGSCVTKPKSKAVAADFLRKFSGKPQNVYTALAMSTPRGEPRLEISESTVKFRVLNDAIIDKYLSKVNPLDKAGGYDINQHGQLIIESYSGSYTNIMGLPRETVVMWLVQEGYL
jgi:septum formation protein